MTDLKILILGLKKAGVILHAVALGMKDENSRRETMALVGCIAESVRLIEAVRKGKERGVIGGGEE